MHSARFTSLSSLLRLPDRALSQAVRSSCTYRLALGGCSLAPSSVGRRAMRWGGRALKSWRWEAVGKSVLLLGRRSGVCCASGVEWGWFPSGSCFVFFLSQSGRPQVPLLLCDKSRNGTHQEERAGIPARRRRRRFPPPAPHDGLSDHCSRSETQHDDGQFAAPRIKRTFVGANATAAGAGAAAWALRASRCERLDCLARCRQMRTRATRPTW